MSFNAGSVDLEVLFDTKEKAEQFIKKFAEGYRQDLSSFPPSFTKALLINSSSPTKQYFGLKAIYESIIIPKVEDKIRSRLRKKNPGLSDAQFNLLFGREKEKDLELSRKNLEYTRISGAYNVIRTGETESNLPSGFGLGKATCGTCSKVKKDGEKGWKLGEWKEKGIPKTYFCSQGCFDKFDWNSYGSPKAPTCHFCRQQYQQGTGVYFENNPGMVFCSEKCARNWEKEVWNKKNLAKQRQSFIEETLKSLEGWNLLSDEEKKNFINQVNNSESSQFRNIWQQAKKLISEKQSDGEGKGNENGNGYNNNGPSQSEGEETGNETEGDSSDNNSEPNSDDNSNTNELPENIQEIAHLPLPQAQQKSEQEIEKSLKENGISDQELNKENWLGGKDWKDYLKGLDTPQKVAEFTHKIRQSILKKALANPTSNEDKKPNNDLILPAVIIILSLLALITLIIIIRKRKKQRGF